MDRHEARIKRQSVGRSSASLWWEAKWLVDDADDLCHVEYRKSRTEKDRGQRQVDKGSYCHYQSEGEAIALLKLRERLAEAEHCASVMHTALLKKNRQFESLQRKANQASHQMEDMARRMLVGAWGINDVAKETKVASNPSPAKGIVNESSFRES